MCKFVLREGPKTIDPDEKRLLLTVSLITQHAFGQRRKMIRSSLKPLFSVEELEEMNLNPCCRAEELTVSDYVKMAKNFREHVPVV